MTSKLSAILCVPLLFSSHALFANNISFNYLDIHYTNFKFDDNAKASHGIGIKGSYLFYGPFFASASYAYTSHEEQDEDENQALDIKIAPLTLSLGAKHDLTQNLTGYGSFSYIKADWGGSDVTMNQVELGLRSQIVDDLELLAAFTSSKISDLAENEPCYEYNEYYERTSCSDSFSRNAGYKIGLNLELPNYSSLTAEYSMIAGQIDLAQLKIGFRTSF